tara:strand:+ start:14746 stop:15231 length:486 start_codon:yes stop_codon:yes gene_type:complete
MPSFDVVSKVDLNEVDNAINMLMRIIVNRFDFKGSNCTINRNESEIVILADDQTKLTQMLEMFKENLVKRKLDPRSLVIKKEEKASGDAIRQTSDIHQGIEQDICKKITKSVKEIKLKVQVKIQGDELRVIGKNRDDLQAAIKHIKDLNIEQPLQFVNYRN